MKKIFNILVAMMCCLSCVSCGDDDWDYDHSQEHVYFSALRYGDTTEASLATIMWLLIM